MSLAPVGPGREPCGALRWVAPLRILRRAGRARRSRRPAGKNLEEVTSVRRDRAIRRRRRRPPRTARAALTGLGVLALAACAAGNGAAVGDPVGGPEDDRLVLEGRLTDEGVECPAFRSEDDDTLYTLTGDLQGFGPGDRVRIVARPVEMSFCMQGTTVEVLEISAL